jgi:hypothetical protein
VGPRIFDFLAGQDKLGHAYTVYHNTFAKISGFLSIYFLAGY